MFPSRSTHHQETVFANNRCEEFGGQTCNLLLTLCPFLSSLWRNYYPLKTFRQVLVYAFIFSHFLSDIKCLYLTSFKISQPIESVQTTLHCWHTVYTNPSFRKEITRVIIKLWVRQESAMRMNGLHQSNSKLNIRIYPESLENRF